MKDFKVLRVLDQFSGFFEKLGVDYPVMRKILQMKLIMDGRRTPTVLSGGVEKKEQNNSFLKSLWIYVLMGAITIPFVLMKQNYIFPMGLVFGIMIFMVMTSLISDFSSVLLDIRDKNIISSRPVGDRTISAAKVVHVCIYMFSLTISLMGIPAIVALVRQGVLFFLVFVAEIILADLFIVVLTALMYLLVLKFFDGEKLKDIINYVQIALALVMSIGYQFIGRLFSFTLLGGVSFTPKWWQFFIIPVWFGAPFEVLMKGSTNIYYLILAAFAVLVPIFSICLYIRLMPAFERNLQKLSSYNENRKENKKMTEKIANIICFSKEEKVFFRFATDMMKNEREFKLKVYPSLGLSMAFPLIFLFRDFHPGDLGKLAGTRWYFYIYFSALLMPTTILMLKHSNNYKGAWIYKTIPIKDISSVFRGTIKAMIVKLFIPVFFIESILFVFVFGIGIFSDMIAVFLNILFFTAVCFRLMKPVLPFSESYEDAKGESFSMLPALFGLGLLAAIHFGCSFLRFGTYAVIVVLLLADIILWKKAFKISWESLDHNKKPIYVRVGK